MSIATHPLVGFLPSPSSGVLHLGPATIHMYGVMLLLGIVGCVALTLRRWEATGGNADLVFRVAIWGVLWGFVGARIYHVITSWSLVPTPKWEGVFEVWNGGLGIWGGVLFGCAAGALVVCRAHANVRSMLDARRCRTGNAACTGNRTLGQLVESRALRASNQTSVGARDKRNAQTARLSRVRDVPSDLSLRVAVGHRVCWSPVVGR